MEVVLDWIVGRRPHHRGWSGRTVPDAEQRADLELGGGDRPTVEVEAARPLPVLHGQQA